MARLSVVVPIYNVEEFLGACLDSIAAQTFGDLEVVLVNDGSTDSSPQIAEAYAAKDSRFKVVHRPNGGLSAARNTGIEHATGELLAFVDSDDLLLPDAYAKLVGSLDKTGSDFATGKVLRLTGKGTRPARFLVAAFRRTLLRTHITRHRPLLADRIAWNKVFRRSFWDEHGLRFPEGRIHEDIPVILPLHFSARSVDVIAEPVYLWRFRESGELSITERRMERRALLHRLQAVTEVHDFLAEHGPRKARRWYDEVLVADDLKHYINVLDRADDEYRALFLEKVNALLDRADDDIYEPLRAIERLKWHLVRRRLLPELLEVLRFQRGELDARAPVRVGRHWYGDYPYRGDPRLAIPDRVFRLDRELAIKARIDGMRLEDGRLRVDGFAYIEGIGAAHEGAQQVGLALLRPGPLRRARYVTSAIRLETRGVHRPEVNARARQRAVDVAWSGFTATLDPARLRRRGGWRDGRWELFVMVRAGGVRRVFKLFSFEDLLAPGAVELPAPGEVLARAAPVDRREVAVTVQTRWAAVASHALADGAVELSGEVRGCALDRLRLEVREADGTRSRRYPVETIAGAAPAFTARIPLADLALLGASPDDEEDEDDEDDVPAEAPLLADPSWELHLRDGAGPVRVALRETALRRRAAWPAGSAEVALVRTPGGDAAFVVREPHAVLTSARWDGDGVLALAAEGVPGGDGALELVLASRDGGVQRAFPAHGAGPGRIEAAPTPAAVPSLDGPHPLPEGHWRLGVRPLGGGAAAPLSVAPGLAATLPLDVVVAHKRFGLAADRHGDAVLAVGRDLDDDERGGFHAGVLRRTAYAARRTEPLRDAVVFSSFRGRQVSDSPRAIHEELVRRGAPLEHLWVVRDGQATIPDGATALRSGSREHHEALARARVVVTNDHFPSWFERRADQLCVQTWHGTPLKRHGFDMPRRRGAWRAFERHWDRQVGNWQVLVSPSPFATATLRQAFRLEPEEVLETGLPRTDVLLAADGEARGREVRRRLGLPEGARVVLYAPTYRDHLRDRRGRFRLDVQLDLQRLRDALGPDVVVLFRRHHAVADDAPSTPDGFVRDVSGVGDATELLLAADVLVTDYSSLAVDFAVTGRPTLFFAYDLEAYRDEIRGFSLDFEAVVPGPVLRTTDEVAEALRDLDAVRAAHAGRLEAFRQRLGPVGAGDAAARVADRILR